jgi:hypothetical protein
VVALGTAAALNLAAISTASAHCDSMDGPVISEAQVALANGEVTPLLKWVPAHDETTITRAFNQARKVRGVGPDAQQMADQYFFSTLVRVHRASEGAPFTGIKPAGNIEPAVMAADSALESGSVDELVAKVTTAVERGIRKRYEAAQSARQDADRSVEQGRAFVESYVQYVHYVENIHEAASSGGSHAHDAPSAQAAQ